VSVPPPCRDGRRAPAPALRERHACTAFSVGVSFHHPLLSLQENTLVFRRRSAFTLIELLVVIVRDDL
jgi:hypothetical protein